MQKDPSPFDAMAKLYNSITVVCKPMGAVKDAIRLYLLQSTVYLKASLCNMPNPSMFMFRDIIVQGRTLWITASAK